MYQFINFSDINKKRNFNTMNGDGSVDSQPTWMMGFMREHSKSMKRLVDSQERIAKAMDRQTLVLEELTKVLRSKDGLQQSENITMVETPSAQSMILSTETELLPPKTEVITSSESVSILPVPCLTSVPAENSSETVLLSAS